jgi:hypothetical protein
MADVSTSVVGANLNFSLAQSVGWDCLIVGLLLLGLFDFGFFLATVTIVTLLAVGLFYCWCFMFDGNHCNQVLYCSKFG